jgi:hypothetical protein
MFFAKGDVRVQGDVGGECKFTKAKSYSLKLADLMKIRSEALSRGEDWVLQLEFVGQAGQSQKVAVIDWNSYVEMRSKE